MAPVPRRASGVFAAVPGPGLRRLAAAVGVIALIATLVGWLADAVKEYAETVEADTTGHLENGPAPADAVAPLRRR